MDKKIVEKIEQLQNSCSKIYIDKKQIALIDMATVIHDASNCMVFESDSEYLFYNITKLGTETVCVGFVYTIVDEPNNEVQDIMSMLKSRKHISKENRTKVKEFSDKNIKEGYIITLIDDLYIDLVNYNDTEYKIVSTISANLTNVRKED